jgi:hypothetical protein
VAKLNASARSDLYALPTAPGALPASLPGAPPLTLGGMMLPTFAATRASCAGFRLLTLTAPTALLKAGAFVLL